MPSIESNKLPDDWSAYELPSSLPTPVIRDPALPLVSIVTPSYNQGAFIRETIQSVLTQDYPNIEYWVIDGGSTDETVNILKEFAVDPRFHWVSERDRGQGDAVNKGWRRSQGTIFGWLNSDDIYLPGAIRQQVSYLLDHPTVDIVFGDALFVDAQGKRIGKYWGRPFSQYNQLRSSCIPQPSAFLRRSCVEQTGPIDRAYNFALDYEYWLRASAQSNIVYHSTEIATYRMHATSKTVSGAAKFNNELERILANFFASPQISPELRAHQTSFMADRYASMGLNCVKNGERKEAFQYLKRSLQQQYRQRALLLLLHLLDPTQNMKIAVKLNEYWNYFHSRWLLNSKPA